MARNIKRKMLVLGMVLMLALGLSSVAKADGEVYIIAKIYNSDGDFIGENTSTIGRLLVIDKDTGETKIDDAIIITNGYVAHAVSVDAIDPGDRIRIWIVGSLWDDADYYAHILDSQDDIDFKHGGIPGDSFEAQTYKYIPLNLKPLIALIFIILILLFGYLFLAALHRQKVNVAITGRDRVQVRTPQGLKETWTYKCSYGEPGDLTELGEFSDEREHDKSSILKVSVRKIVKQPDDTYAWYRPKALDMTKMPQEKRPTEVDDVKKIDTAWFQAGAIKLKKGQTMKNASRRHAHILFAAFVYPFLLLELIFGLGSFIYEPFRFPPSIWMLIINILILIIALIFQTIFYWKGAREEKKPKPETPAEEPPEKLEEWKPEKPEVEEAPKVAPEEELPKAVPAKPVKVVKPKVVAPPKAAPAKKACPNCGQDVGADFVVCPFCGAELK